MHGNSNRERQGMQMLDRRWINQEKRCVEIAGLREPGATAASPATGLPDSGDPELARLALARTRQAFAVC
ncbi:hypothetical protein D9M72_550060 [compost metagenome]